MRSRRDVLEAISAVGAMAAAGCTSFDGEPAAVSTQTPVRTSSRTEGPTDPPTNTAEATTTTDSVTGIEWPMYGLDGRNSKYIEETIPSDPRFDLEWEFYPPGDSIYVGEHPSIAEGLVFTASPRGTLHAVELASGTERWNYRTGTDMQFTPAVHDRLVFTLGRDNVTALDAESGNVEWQFVASGTGFSRQYGANSPTFHDGTLIATTGVTNDTVFALDVESGEELWRFASEPHVSTPAVDDSGVYLVSEDERPGTGDGVLFALDVESGEERWRSELNFDTYSYPSLDDTRVYCGTGDGALFALDKLTGAEQWRVDTGLAARSSAVVAAGTVVIRATTDIIAVDAATGTENWQSGMGSARYSFAVVENAVISSGPGAPVILDLETGEFVGGYDDTQEFYDIVTQPTYGDGLMVFGTARGIRALSIH